MSSGWIALCPPCPPAVWTLNHIFGETRLLENENQRKEPFQSKEYTIEM
jgi:hypothetical protein